MTHQIDTNDLEFAEKRYGKMTGWIPGAIDQKTGKINPQVTQMVREDGKFVSVFHVKPIYYETYTGHWRPLSEVTTHHGNHKIIFNENWWKVHPRYLAWLDKRCQLIGGQLLIPSTLKSYPTPYTGVVRSLHESLVPLKLGLTTSTFYPDPDPETTTIDGRTQRAGVNETWSNIRSGAGTGNASTDANGDICWYQTSGTTSQFGTLERSLYLFDTSAITDTDTIDSATMSIHGTSKADPFSDAPQTNVSAVNPASNTAIANSDYGTYSDTAFATAVSYAGFSTSAYNDYVFNASGLAAISLTGVSKFSVRQAKDISNTSPTWGSSNWTGFSGYFAEQTGTSSDPKLVVVHTAAGGGATFIPRVSFIM